MTSKMFSTLDSFDTILSADSVEWCPIENFRDIFVCGTYKLLEKESIDASESQKRVGRIYLFQVEHGRLNLLEQLEGAAVLDMKWARSTVSNKILLGVANAKGMLQIYELIGDSRPCLRFLKQIHIEKPGEVVLALSLDWSMGEQFINNLSTRITVSVSNGSVHVFELTDETLEEIKSWHGHEYEAWITAFDYWNPNIIYSGGDDSKFKSFDIRVDTPVMINRSHTAGVTSLHSNPGEQFLLASGSYDERLRLWDTRKLGRPISKTNLEGSVWRLKWNTFENNYLLAACSHSGFRVLDCKNIEKPIILAEYNEHESLAYGCDWSFLNSTELFQRDLYPEPGRQISLVSTCSFYDHLLNLAIIEF
ncbi:diphthine methyltransferase [Belonocnema kinseyi]|uniref:diphthine methyltransferase n=1 Tax=Belonocnema kinseyi TaxID=2817044 RepID=UPI00143DB61B|nr:diphthine methyltransferase [Belonocnema kinseyi]XP_033213691.1 diphthine methyltransferase [Belonocnema kinseyi]